MMADPSDKKTGDDTYGDSETVERREAALKRMLATPHKPHNSTVKAKGSPATRKAGKGRSRIGKSKV